MRYNNLITYRQDSQRTRAANRSARIQADFRPLNSPTAAQQATHSQPFLSPHPRPSCTRIPTFRPSLCRTCKQGFACWIFSLKHREAKSFRKQQDVRSVCKYASVRQEVDCLDRMQKQAATIRIRGRLFFLLARGHALSDPCDIAQSSSAKASASLSSSGLNPRDCAEASISDFPALPLPVACFLIVPTGTP